MLPGDTLVGRLLVAYMKDAVTCVVIMVFEGINTEVFHVLKLLQVSAMTMTLHNEYHRDLDKHLPIQSPIHYYRADGSVDYSWSTAAIRFYANWVG